MERAASVAEIISALGGTQEVAAMFDLGEPAVANWRAQNRLPAHTFPTIQQSLISRGVSADMSLWTFGRKKSARRASAEAAE